jgi:hypothetical protein
VGFSTFVSGLEFMILFMMFIHEWMDGWMDGLMGGFSQHFFSILEFMVF